MPAKRAAVVVGVDKPGGLPKLNAAASSAAMFATWASSESFDVELITDQTVGAVEVSSIKKAVRKFVEAATYSHLVVYFSGHGVLRGPDYELWLLSNAPGDPNEAVVVPLSIYHARNSGISHIVFVSDACRSVPDTPLLNAVTGSSIFPNQQPGTRRPEVDVFYATLPGDPSYEVSANEAVKSYRALFTECLLDGLKKRPPEIMEHRAEPPPPCWVIPAWTMKKYLEERVPEAAEAVSIQLVQNPDIRVESHEPNCLVECLTYRFAAEEPGGPPPRTPSPPAPPSPTEREKPFHLLEHIQELPSDAKSLIGVKLTGPIARLLEPQKVQSDVTQLLNAKGRQSFETRTGFTVVGTRVMLATVSGIKVDPAFEESGAQQVRIYWETSPRPGKSLLLQFENGIGTVLAPLYGFIGTVVVNEGRVVNVSYVPSRGTENYLVYEANAAEIDKRHAYVAAAALHGSFRIDPAQAEKIAGYLRLLKSVDPTLGLYAAYAYAQVGALDAVNSVFRYMSEAPEPIPFDVALLAGKLPKGIGVKPQDIAPFCPMLTQGWAMLADQDIPPQVKRASECLMPSLWTTFRPEGVDILRRAINAGELQ